MPRVGLRALTTPPDRFRVGPFREEAFRSRLRSRKLASLLGLGLGVMFLICFVTGVLSHLIQHPPSWFSWPSRPAGLYRITQGVHVVTGLASIPLLLGKLWTVYPRLWTWPPINGVAHLVERIALLPLVAGSIFLLFTGVADIALWYPWRFFFPAGHYWAAWITMGALLVHIGAKASIVRRELTAQGLDVVALPGEGLTRRSFLGVIAATSGLITITTVGQTLRPLNFAAILAPRRPDVGPQGFPVNKTAAGARVIDAARDPGYALEVVGRVSRPLRLSLEQLRAMPQHEATLPIACVEGWSADARWQGVPVAHLLDVAGAGDDVTVVVESMQPTGLYRESELNESHARDPDTLLALKVNGETFHIDHGFPVRLIGPNRPGVMQTKWVNRLSVT